MALVLPLFETTSTLIPQDQLLAASARISSVMGSSYAPFLPSVLPHLLKVVLEEADVSITVCLIFVFHRGLITISLIC